MADRDEKEGERGEKKKEKKMKEEESSIGRAIIEHPLFVYGASRSNFPINELTRG